MADLRRRVPLARRSSGANAQPVPRGRRRTGVLGSVGTGAALAAGCLVGAAGLAVAGAAPAGATVVTARRSPSSTPIETTAASCPSTLPSGTPVVGIAVPKSGVGYWEVDQAGKVAAIGGAPCYGSAPTHLNQPIVGMASTPGGTGYWLVAADGGIFSFGAAGFYGSMGGQPLNQPVVGMTSSPDGHGYLLVAADGGVFAFGDATFHGSMGGQALNQPVRGISMTPDGQGYVEVARDGGIFAFGNAVFHGSMGGTAINSPVVGVTMDATTGGYWEVAGDGGIFAFDAPFYGSKGGTSIAAPATAIAATTTGTGYRLVLADGEVAAYGTAHYDGEASLAAHTVLRCLSSQLSASLPRDSAAAGNIGLAIGLENTSQTSCYLYGYAGAGLVSSQDALLPVTTHRGADNVFGDPGPSPITLAPGKTAYFDVGFADVTDGQPTSHRLEINVPTGTNPMFFTTSWLMRAYPQGQLNVNAMHLAPAITP